MKVLNIVGWIGAHIFAATVLLPMIFFFIVYAVLEYAATGKYSNANEMSQRMGRQLEIPAWRVRSLNGLLPIDPPKHINK